MTPDGPASKSISCEWEAEFLVWKIDPGDSFDFSQLSNLITETDWKGARRYLWDLRSLEQGPDSSPEIRGAAGLVERSQDLWAGSRVAVVVSRDFDFGLARMFSAFAEEIDVEYRAFRDEASALGWLGERPEA
jgi:hypothetical protein